MQFTRPGRPPRMFATGECAVTRMIALCDEILNRDRIPRDLRDVAAWTKEGCGMLLSLHQLPTHRVETPVDEDTADAKGRPAVA